MSTVMILIFCNVIFTKDSIENTYTICMDIRSKTTKAYLKLIILFKKIKHIRKPDYQAGAADLISLARGERNMQNKSADL